MAKDYLIDIYYVDDDDLYLNYFRKRFQLDIPYSLYTYNSGKKFLRHYIQDCKKRRNQKIVIMDYLLKSGDEHNAKTLTELLPIIKHHNPDTEVIILSRSENLNIKPTAGDYTPAAFIKKDDNAFDHISNTIKRFAAKYELNRRYKQSKDATYIFIFVMIAAVLAALVMYFIGF
jgi:DNA-binding NarL/FixJ family response regulator